MKMASLIEFPFSSQINEQVLRIRRLSQMIIEWFHHVPFCWRTRELVAWKNSISISWLQHIIEIGWMYAITGLPFLRKDLSMFILLPSRAIPNSYSENNKNVAIVSTTICCNSIWTFLSFHTLLFVTHAFCCKFCSKRGAKRCSSRWPMTEFIQTLQLHVLPCAMRKLKYDLRCLLNHTFFSTTLLVQLISFWSRNSNEFRFRRQIRIVVLELIKITTN